MDQLLGVLAHDPAQLGSHIARYETWRTPESELATADLVERVPLPAPVRKARLVRNLRSAPEIKPITQPEKLLKLYQPAHQRYYIVAATLACAVPGLPDRTPRGAHEKTGFVLRRLLPAASNDSNAPLVEFGFVKSAQGNHWQRIASVHDDSAIIAPGEEILPVFPLSHSDSQTVNRTLWGGLIPIGRREDYLATAVSRTPVSLVAGQQSEVGQKSAPLLANDDAVVARMTEFKMDVAEPWKALIREAQKAAIDIADDKNETDVAKNAIRQGQLYEKNLQYQMQSWLILVDLRAYLERNLQRVWTAILDPSARIAQQFSPGEDRLYNWLSTPLDSATISKLRGGFSSNSSMTYHSSLADALRALRDVDVDKLEDVETQYRGPSEDWPSFHYLFAGIGSNGNGTSIAVAGTFGLVSEGLAGEPAVDLTELELSHPKLEKNGAFSTSLIDKVTTLVVRALPRNNEANARPLPFAQKLAKTMRDTQGDAGLFCIRLVHLNEDCGPLHPPTLSLPTERFQLASFFDSDAPARPIRITLPMDTTPAGLRKHARGTAFVMSNLLCGQVQRAKGLGFVDLVLQVLPWPFHKPIKIDDPGETGGCKDGSLDIGMICSLSIPIITICALILLMMIVLLLDFIFRWIPWFIMCFPIPGFKGKVKGP